MIVGRSKGRRVLLRGYYGLRNTGDDALLVASAWGARRVFGGDSLLVASGSELPRASGFAAQPVFLATQRFRGEFRLRMAIAAARSSSIVFGGGSVFHSVSGLRRDSRLMRLAGPGPHLACGVSIGPFKAAEDERECARTLRRLSFVGVRDATSYDIVRALAPRVDARLAFDLAPLLPLASAPRVDARKRRGVGVALCDYERFTGGDVRRERTRREKMVSALSSLDPSVVEEIIFVDFNGHPQLGDRRVHEEIAKQLAGAQIPVRHLRYVDDPTRVLEEVRGLRAIIAMRLHAAVFGFLTQTPTVLLSYHSKCDGWAREIGLDPTLVHDSVEFAPVGIADAAHRCIRGEVRSPLLTVEHAQERALQNFPLIA